MAEDEADRKVFEEFEIQKKNGTLKTHPIAELWEEVGVEAVK